MSIPSLAASLVATCEQVHLQVFLPKDHENKRYIRLDTTGNLTNDPKAPKASLKQIANLVKRVLENQDEILNEAQFNTLNNCIDRLLYKVGQKKRQSRWSCFRDLFYAIFRCAKSPEKHLEEARQQLGAYQPSEFRTAKDSQHVKSDSQYSLRLTPSQTLIEQRGSWLHLRDDSIKDGPKEYYFNVQTSESRWGPPNERNGNTTDSSGISQLT